MLYSTYLSQSEESQLCISCILVASQFASVSPEVVQRVSEHVANGSSSIPQDAEERKVHNFLMIEKGPPSFCIAINPADMYNPIVKFLASSEIDVDNLLPSDVPNYWYHVNVDKLTILNKGDGETWDLQLLSVQADQRHGPLPMSRIQTDSCRKSPLLLLAELRARINFFFFDFDHFQYNSCSSFNSH